MKDLARRFPENPLLLPKDLKPSRDEPKSVHFSGKDMVARPSS